MADKSDAEQVLATMAAAAVYPNGTSNPSASVAGVTITVARGWPEPGSKQLDGIIAAGNAMVTVYSAPGMGANTRDSFRKCRRRRRYRPRNLP